jgi:hypothetical protein
MLSPVLQFVEVLLLSFTTTWLLLDLVDSGAFRRSRPSKPVGTSVFSQTRSDSPSMQSGLASAAESVTARARHQASIASDRRRKFAGR